MGGSLIVGMAGHIDHGKSALVTALTGMPMDRLAEERRRGITIDLNFAPLALRDDAVAGVIDVPGHEDFVRTMVAGASGVDFALLVIAADEGIMPQTLEHLAVLEHLRIPAGIPVITKADLVSKDALESLSAAIADRLAASVVRFERPLATSVRNGDGIDELKARIAASASPVASRMSSDLFRLPIDRAFSVRGVGTVLTGTVWSGTIAVGDEVLVLPGALWGRVRSVESHGRSLQRSEPRARTAVGLAGVDRSAIDRGDVVVAQRDPWQVTTAFDAELTVHADAPRPIGTRTRIRVLLGTAESMARVLPRTPIPPGGTGLARLALEHPIVARGGDLFVVRSYSPVSTIGGGRVLDPAPPRRGAWPPGLAAETPGVRLRALVERRPEGIPQDRLPVLLGLPPDDIQPLLADCPGARRVGDRWVSAAVVETAAARALAVLAGHHAREPGSAGMSVETLRRALHRGNGLAQAALGDLESAGRIRVSAGTAALSEFHVSVAGGEGEIGRIVGLIDAAGLAPPSISELASRTSRPDLAAILRVAAERGLVKAVERDRYYSVRALEGFSAALLDAARDGVITPSALRDRLGVSRKYVIPLLEWADRQGITVRGPEGRRLVPAKR